MASRPLPDPEFGIGDRGFSNDGNVYIYGQFDTAAAGVATVGMAGGARIVEPVPAIDHRAGIGRSLDRLLAGGPHRRGLGVGADRGRRHHLGVVGVRRGVPLYPTTTAGVLDDASAGTVIVGVTLVATVTGNGTRTGSGNINGVGRVLASLNHDGEGLRSLPKLSRETWLT